MTCQGMLPRRGSEPSRPGGLEDTAHMHPSRAQPKLVAVDCLVRILAVCGMFWLNQSGTAEKNDGWELSCLSEVLVKLDLRLG